MEDIILFLFFYIGAFALAQYTLFMLVDEYILSE